MKVRYVFPLARPLKLEDHWPVPLLGGEVRLKEESGLVVAIEFTKSGVSADLAFSVVDTPNEKSKATITGNDTLLPIVRDHIQRAFSFLQCFFNTDTNVEQVEVYHEPETNDEERKIPIPWFQMSRADEPPLPLTYDFITRALIAAEEQEGPEFVSSLAKAARESLMSKRFIDSFRFSFLLVESLYGGGKFKSKQLKQQLSSSAAFVDAVQHAIGEWVHHSVKTPSATLSLMSAAQPSVDEVIDHLVDMRGHYFHGNLAKSGAWHPAKQGEAEALAWLCIDVVSRVAANAATPMFSDEYAKRHAEQAKEVGAIVTMQVDYFFRVPEDDLVRRQRLNITMPGTKPTTVMVMEAASKALEHFKEEVPFGRLHSVVAKHAADGKQVFTIRFHTEPDPPPKPTPVKR